MNIYTAAEQPGTWQREGPDVAPFLPVAAEHVSLALILAAHFARTGAHLRDRELRHVTDFFNDLAHEERQ